MIRSLSLTNFRSYKTISLDFSNNLTVISGPNAVGKTNLLEAIFVAATSRSFRAADTDLINDGEVVYRVVAEFDQDSVELAFNCSTNGLSQKRLKLNQKKHTMSSLLGRNPITLFEPNDMNLFTSSPEHRRRYMDIVLSQSDKHYAASLSSYKKVLRQRNSLLHNHKLTRQPLGSDEVFVWDVSLAQHAKAIFTARAKFISTLSPLIGGFYKDIAGQEVEIELKYIPKTDLSSIDMLEALSQSLSHDKAAGFTTVGPHRDDMSFVFKSGDINSTASRGETRSAILALKLAEMSYIESKLSKKPILLLDDVFSELDKSRREHLLAMISDHQALLTTTEVDTTIPKNSYIIDLSGAR